MSSEARRFDAIVIGSGIGGLTAALTVARRERSVLVLEAGKQFGGYTNPFKRRAYSFDPGLHYIGECGPGGHFSRLIERLGLDDLRFRELSPDGFDRLVFPGYEVRMPKGAERYHERLARDFPHEKQGLERFFKILRDFKGAIASLDKIRGAASALKAAPHLPFLVKYFRATYKDLLDPIIKDPLLKAVLGAQGGDYGLPPGKASAMIGLGLIDHYLGGAYFPIGGSRAVRDAFVKGIEAHGGVMKRNHAVERIHVENGKVTGVRCANGEEFFAETVISNADAGVTYREMIGADHLSSSMKKKTEKTQLSLASVCLFIGLEGDVAKDGMTDANIWHYPSIDLERAYAPLARGEMPPEDFFFLSSPSLKDPDSPDKAPPGHSTLELVTLVPYAPFTRWAGTKTMKRGDGYAAMKEQLADRYLRCVERYVPGVRARIKVLEVATPLTNVSFAAAPAGNIYGPDYTPDQMGPWRYAAKGEVGGLYLCGSSTLGAGIVPAALSGATAGKMAAKGAPARAVSAPVPARVRAAKSDDAIAVPPAE
ncbi:MAG: NAD(P)/FAD-dependent oxidoreductase [Minicystis sp.]